MDEKKKSENKYILFFKHFPHLLNEGNTLTLLITLVDRMFTNDLGDLGSIPSRVIL